MARNTPATAKCFGFAAAMKLTRMDENKLHTLADKYGTTDITADYLSAAQDMHAYYSEIAKQLAGPAQKSVGVSVPETVFERPTEESVNQVANAFVEQFGDNAPPIKILPNGKGVIPGSDGTEKGVHHNGTVYLFTDNLVSNSDAAETLWHETLHYGLRKLLTKEQFVEQMMGLYNRDAFIKERADAWTKTAEAKEALDFGGPEYALARGVDETIARLAQVNGGEYTKNGPLDRAYRSVLSWLADMAQTFGLTEVAAKIRGLKNQEARAYVQNVFARVKAGESVSSVQRFEPAFSKAVQSTIDTTNAATTSDINRLRSMMTPKVKDNWTNVTEYFKKAAPWLLSNYQIVEQYGKKFDEKAATKKGALANYVGLQQTMTQERLTQSMEFNKVAIRWDAMAPNAKERLNKLMLRATLDGIHPDEAFTPGTFGTPNGHLTAADKPKYDALKAQYDALGKGSEAQKIYGESRDLLRKQWDERQEAYKKLVDYVFSDRMRKAADRKDDAGVLNLKKQADDALNDYKKERAKLKGPYFPLMRFGAYLAIGESPALAALKKKESEATGAERTALTKQLEAMRVDPKHYEVSAHESRGALNAAVRAMEGRFGKGSVRVDMQDQQLEGIKDGSAKIISELGNMLDSTFDPEIAGAVNDAMANVYLRSLPEMHALRREAHRKGIEGANADMLRAFASAGQSGSFYMSRMKHASEMTETMFNMKREAKGDIDMQHIHREMEKRMALDMQFKETPIQDTISSVSWVYHLGMSPSAMLINTTQPWMVTLPMLAGKYSLGKATRAMGTAHKDAVKVLAAARMKDGKWDWWSGISENSLTDTEERTSLRALMTKGIVDEGLQHELNVFADGKTRWLANFNRRVGWMNQQIELTNRTASALAAFRLAKQSGMDYEAALKSAYDVTLNSQFDYSQEGTARFMREGGGVPMAKLVFQFRKFQQGMLYALGANIKKLKGPDQKEAAATLAYLATTSGLMAGALGLPFFAVAAGIANAFIDDDDPEGDAETRIRNWLVEITGDKKMAAVLAKGIPAALGVDISARIGLGDIASPFPMERFDGDTGKDQAGKLAVAALGPAAGLAARMYDGANSFAEGDWAKGFEKTTPKIIADVFKGGRYAGEGLTTGSGNATDAGIDGIDAALRAVGLNPLAESNYYDRNRADKDVESAMTDRRNSIATQFKKSFRSGDMGSVREKISAFNQDHPTQRITPKMETAWRQNATTPADNKTAKVARY